MEYIRTTIEILMGIKTGDGSRGKIDTAALATMKSNFSSKEQSISYETLLQQMENESREHIGVIRYIF